MTWLESADGEPGCWLPGEGDEGWNCYIPAGTLGSWKEGPRVLGLARVSPPAPPDASCLSSHTDPCAPGARTDSLRALTGLRSQIHQLQDGRHQNSNSPALASSSSEVST